MRFALALALIIGLLLSGAWAQGIFTPTIRVTGSGVAAPCSGNAFLVNTGVRLLVNTGNTLCVQ